ncbi:hypothetical protein B5P37_10140 [Staphylococcus lutrae]|uniref:Uncharacterized protein n=1 Tax=Staphylococcus lutrae TaxID=155085 RepID=A0AAC9RSI2_9STAP|nr:hypothetical protein B5P37_10140 [Staphylococcus lutrae]
MVGLGKQAKPSFFCVLILDIDPDSNADLLEFQEPVYSNGKWKINTNNKSSVGANIIIRNY